MSITTYIEVKFQWPGVHSWPGASGTHEYLKCPHRHLFKGVARIEVLHDDRELEFLEVLDYILEGQKDGQLALHGSASCEQIASAILDRLLSRYGDARIMIVSVLEDGENGALVQWMP
jgi:hypothetical protein